MELLLKLFHGTHRFRALVVDDNSDLARLVAILLEHCGFEVRTLANGRAVLATARVFRPHVILLDIGLPGIDGYQVAALPSRRPRSQEHRHHRCVGLQS